ncbi:MAG TPA: hypothetical protein VG962_09235 [Steroidobacteraceae bacterium]|nr:hypothetical protein [Steroidobacteraceae bacterium]
MGYFLDRFEGDDRLETIASNLARDFVDPFLESKEVIEKKAQALTSGENRAALVFLELQWQDDSREKDLTKTAFDALVRMALRSTNAEHRLSRSGIHSAISGLIPAKDTKFVAAETDKALARLAKQYIRHYPKTDEYCLTHEESERLKGRLSEIEIDDRKLCSEIVGILKSVVSNQEKIDDSRWDQLVSASRISIEKFLLHRGELFVAALDSGQMSQLGFDVVHSIVESVLKSDKRIPTTNNTFVDAVVRTVERVMTDPGDATSKYLRGIADAYTLLAFLRETPDVQSAVKKMFSSGEIWLDTSIVLPLLAETLLSEEQWQFRRLISVAQGTGLKIKVTRGVIEEVERHINRAQTCAAMNGEPWRGAYPYLFAFYVATGSAHSNFPTWLSEFRGDVRPEDDISEYLQRTLLITTSDLSEASATADQELRSAVMEAWTQIHIERRNRNGQDFDQLLALRLAEHDTENYVGVIVRRQQEGASAFGYTSWWLTLDHMAFEITSRIAPNLTGRAPESPVMSADFLTNYLAFGPLREKVARKTNAALPVALDPALVEYLTPELVQLAASVRRDALGLAEHVIRRKVRDALDTAKRRTGEITRRGLEIPIAD